ncbi:SusD-like starch-binding protein associating with outer membrane [Cellulophaga sp. RHA19]|uniref:RagB/SusD family nutrient uptake outer membrane protein n=1 Tax=Cellulophaga sp. RHA19 TaxID=1798237 RepID=UPI000C2C09BD|nr:RagB/SusD family nutrient uptake outer membrane protein [Cellulophaga sp. RHA19]PKB42527.1 SusD-like starch-binding protein associating with outer membrane [Cellulophaga sp. RHA19]
MKQIHIYTLAILTFFMVSCDDYLEIQPEGKVIPESLEEFRAVLTKGYDIFPEQKSRVAYRTDELVLDENSFDFPSYKDVYTWKDANPDPQTAPYPYIQMYNSIFYANHVIEDGKDKIEDSEEKNQLLGEAYALRAYAHFDLVNLYGKPYNATTASSDTGVPLALEIDLEQVFTPVSVQAVYSQVLKDIATSKSLLNVTKFDAGLNYRFTKTAILALETRVHTYMNNSDAALTAVNAALSLNKELVNLNDTPELPNTFTSVESIMALEDVFDSSVRNSSFISDDLVAIYDTTNDLRFGLYFNVDGSSYKAAKGGDQKFKCSFRVSDLVLLKAEAQAKLGALDEAKATLLAFMQNRYQSAHMTSLTTGINAMSANEFMQELYTERWRELALEGHRWFDLRRSNQKAITHSLSGEDFQLSENDPRYILPFPADARLNNPEL